jgi:GNAT superfamily N-acetyltransferase
MVPDRGDLLIRPAQKSDLGAIQGLCEQLGYPASQEALALRLDDILNHPSHALFVAVTAQGEVIAWVHGLVRKLLISDPHVEVGGLVVAEGCRRQGTGELLMAALEDWAGERGIDLLFLRSNVVRQGAHRFYQRLGYEYIKTSKTFRKLLTP